MAEQTFGKEKRIRKRAEFLRVQGAGNRINAAHFLFLLHVSALPGAAGPARLGIVASKKLGNAVARNRVKRLCRACFRLTPGLVPPGIDLVVIPRSGSEGLDLDAVTKEWKRAARSLEQKSRLLLAKPDATTQVAPGSPRAADLPPKSPPQ